MQPQKIESEFELDAYWAFTYDKGSISNQWSKGGLFDTTGLGQSEGHMQKEFLNKIILIRIL